MLTYVFDCFIESTLEVLACGAMAVKNHRKRIGVYFHIIGDLFHEASVFPPEPLDKFIMLVLLGMGKNPRRVSLSQLF